MPLLRGVAFLLAGHTIFRDERRDLRAGRYLEFAAGHRQLQPAVFTRYGQDEGAGILLAVVIKCEAFGDFRCSVPGGRVGS